MDHNAENIETLASQIVSDWDMETLIGYAVCQLENHYLDDEESFLSDWVETFGDE